MFMCPWSMCEEGLHTLSCGSERPGARICVLEVCVKKVCIDDVFSNDMLYLGLKCIYEECKKFASHKFSGVFR